MTIKLFATDVGNSSFMLYKLDEDIQGYLQYEGRKEVKIRRTGVSHFNELEKIYAKQTVLTIYDDDWSYY